MYPSRSTQTLQELRPGKRLNLLHQYNSLPQSHEQAKNEPEAYRDLDNHQIDSFQAQVLLNHFVSTIKPANFLVMSGPKGYIVRLQIRYEELFTAVP